MKKTDNDKRRNLDPFDDTSIVLLKNGLHL